MTYSIKEIYYTLQGEGAQTGRGAVFCRFTGCNLWTGREADRAAAICSFCDTDFLGTDGPGGGVFHTATAVANAVAARWPNSDTPATVGGSTLRSEPERRSAPEATPKHGGFRSPERPRHTADNGADAPFVVCTGGEPLLQLDDNLISAFHTAGFEIAVETNGTIARPDGLDWVCVSPKANTELVVTAGDELKLVYPQPGAEPAQFAHLNFRHFFLQPMDGPQREHNTSRAVEYCLKHPQWRLSLQTHKLLGLP